MEVVMESFGGELRGEFMEAQANKSAEDLAQIRRRLKVSARRNRKLSAATESLLKRVEKAE